MRCVGSPGALDTAAIVCRLPVDMALDTGFCEFGMLLATLFEEWDRSRGKDRWAVGWLCCVQPVTWIKLEWRASANMEYAMAQEGPGESSTYSDMFCIDSRYKYVPPSTHSCETWKLWLWPESGMREWQ